MFSIRPRNLLAIAALFGAASLALAGPLTPPIGPVTSTGKTTTQIEPRVDVATLAGSATAVHIISQPGSYYLTANINVPSGKHGVIISCSNVSLDLNGFAIIGVDGALDGVRCHPEPNPDQIRNISISNGLIEHFDQYGVNAGDACVGLRCDSLSVRSAGFTGFYIWQGLMTKCRVLDCGGGVLAYESNITDCSANNCGTGFSLVNSNISNSGIYFCGFGLDIGSGSFATDINIRGGFNGAFVRDRSVMRRCHITECQNYGIEVWRDFEFSGKDNILDGNTIIGCGTKGITCDGPEAQNNLITGNRVTKCGSGPVDAYAIGSTNRFGPIVNATAAVGGDLGTVANANHPLANLAY